MSEAIEALLSEPPSWVPNDQLTDPLPPVSLYGGRILCIPRSSTLFADHAPLQLAPKEYLIAQRLLQQPDTAIPFGELAVAVWHKEVNPVVDTGRLRSLIVQIARLNKKISTGLNRDPKGQRLITKKSDIGYRFHSDLELD